MRIVGFNAKENFLKNLANRELQTMVMKKLKKESLLEELLQALPEYFGEKCKFYVIPVLFP